MLNGQLHNYTNEQLSRYTNRQLATLNYLGYIFDRSNEDVKRWRALRDKGWDGMSETERMEWLGEIVPTPAASRGMYTHNDLNRVESGVEDLSIRLTEIGYTVPSMVIKTDWTYRDKITKEEMDRYFSNIETIRNIIGVFPSTPKTPTTRDKFTHIRANDVERILNDMSEKVNNLKDSLHYVGEIISGEV